MEQQNMDEIQVEGSQSDSSDCVIIEHPNIVEKKIYNTISIPVNDHGDDISKFNQDLRGKFHSRHITRLNTPSNSKLTNYMSTMTTDDTQDNINNEDVQFDIGQHLHMDFGFVRGSD